MKSGSYFGMRKISIAKDDRGITRMMLNNQFLFQYGPLDQGWWPDGLYTAPSDEALKSDVVLLKNIGMNMLRKHGKVEPARLYYWCDTLGILVWQDMPGGDNTDLFRRRTPESAARLKKNGRILSVRSIITPVSSCGFPSTKAGDSLIRLVSSK